MIYLLIGRRERGKTTLAYSLARKVRKRIVLDPRRIISRSDAEIVTDAMDLGPAFRDLATDATLSEVVYQPRDDDLEESFDRFTLELKRAVTNHPHMPIAVLIDEASFFSLDGYRFQWLAKCTPRDTVHILITAHRPSDIPTSIRAIADHWCIFATTQEHDLKVIESRCGTRVASSARALRDRVYIHWDDARGAMATHSKADEWHIAMRPPRDQKHEIIIDNNDAEWELE